MDLTASTALAFILGTALGSFTNVVIYRLPRRQSLVAPGSRCPRCQSPIRALDNIPLVSFVLLRARCRSCGRPISWRYPMVEVLTGALLAVLWWRSAPQGAWVEFVAGALFTIALVAVFFIDLDLQIVPNVITYPGAVIGLLLAIPQDRLLTALLAAAGAGGVFLLIAVASRGGMGGGDIKLAAMMGAFLSYPDIAVALFIAFGVGALAGVLLIMTGRRSRKDPIPFGPSLAVGGIVALLAAGPIVRWYLGTP